MEFQYGDCRWVASRLRLGRVLMAVSESSSQRFLGGEPFMWEVQGLPSGERAKAWLSAGEWRYIRCRTAAEWSPSYETALAALSALNMEVRRS
jgi:hypothetical protein